MRFKLALAMFCLSVPLAAAETVWKPYDGQTLQETCESEPALCEGYILGIVDARYTEGTFCLKGNVGPATLVDVVKRYLRDHPHYARVDAFALVGNALAEKFPC